MCIYCGTDKYRKIYEKHYGTIPKDDNGRSYDIHHLDGNHSNNDPVNLRAITIQEHYDIHRQQQDWGACLLLAKRMKISTEERSEIATFHNTKRVSNGTHPFLKKDFQKSVQQKLIEDRNHHFLGDGNFQRNIQKKLIDSGSHHFLKREDGSSIASDRVTNGTHPFLGGKVSSEVANRRIREGVHHFLGESNPGKLRWTCEHCGKQGLGISNYNRWHGESCRLANKKQG